MKRKNENGEVVVEASIIVTVVFLFITLMLYISMVIYQQSLVSVMANQTASNLAQVYSNTIKDPFTGYIDADSVYQSVTYSNMKTDAYLDVINKKANAFANYRLKSSDVIEGKSTSVDVDLVKKPNELLKSQIVVTIRDSFDVPLLSVFDENTNSLLEVSATGRADCVDILEYLNGVEAIGDPEDSNVSFLPDSDNCTITFIANKNNPVSIHSSVTVLNGKSILSSNRYTHSVMPSNPANGEFEFAGWVDESNRPFTASTAVYGDTFVYGVWNCTVKLDADGGTVNSVNPYTYKVRVNSRANIPNASRSGYNFKGWYTQKGGRGARYVSNDTVFTGNITLYAHWECAHPSRYEQSTGIACTGVTVYYKCTQCHANLGSYSYSTGHDYSYRCGTRHALRYNFRGNVEGGCGTYHTRNAWCDSCGVTHGSVYGYCVVCTRCSQAKRGVVWCAQKHYLRSGNINAWRTIRNPSNGHIGP